MFLFEELTIPNIQILPSSFTISMFTSVVYIFYLLPLFIILLASTSLKKSLNYSIESKIHRHVLKLILDYDQYDPNRAQSNYLPRRMVLLEIEYPSLSFFCVFVVKKKNLEFIYVFFAYAHIFCALSFKFLQ